MRAVFWLGALGCVACGATERSAPDATSGAAGQAMVQAGSSALSGAGTAGAKGGTSAGGASNAGGSAGGGAAGNAAAGGALAKPCGGDVIGSWVSEVPAAAKSRPSSGDACFNLVLTRGVDGSLESNGQLWVDYRATPVITLLRFNPSSMGFENAYSFSETYRGTLVQDYADACLADGRGKATCVELSDLLTTIGRGEGSYPNVACVPGTSGGCSCSIEVLQTGGSAGPWSVDPKDPTTLVVSTPSPTQFEKYDSFNVPYCVDATGLHFGVGLEQAWPHFPTHNFAKLDCADGKRGPGEDGPDCGFVCSGACK